MFLLFFCFFFGGRGKTQVLSTLSFSFSLGLNCRDTNFGSLLLGPEQVDLFFFFFLLPSADRAELCFICFRLNKAYSPFLSFDWAEPLLVTHFRFFLDGAEPLLVAHFFSSLDSSPFPLKLDQNKWSKTEEPS